MTASAPMARALTKLPESPHAAIGDDLHIAAAGLVHVIAAGLSHVGDRGRHRGVDADRRARSGDRTAAEADQHARRTSAHQVQGRRVVRAPPTMTGTSRS